MALIRSIGSTVFTINATVTLVRATLTGAYSGTITVGEEHILLALLEPAESRLRKTLDLFSVTLDELRAAATSGNWTYASRIDRISSDAERVVLMYIHIDPYVGWLALNQLSFP